MKWVPKNVKQLEWHKWFAWYPVYVEPYFTQIVWLEYVYRRINFNGKRHKLINSK